MRSSILLRAALLAASSLHADWVLQSFDVPARDAAEVRRIYGVTNFSNPTSRTDMVVDEPGILKFVADTLLSEGTAGYSTNIGLNLPLRRSWATKNLTGITALSFELRLSAKPTEGVKVSLVSPGYGKYNDEAKSHGRLLAPAVLPAAGVWKTFTLAIEDLTPPSWWTPPADFPDLDSILKVVQALQFSPGSLYSQPGTNEGAPCTKCVGPTTPEVVVELRNVTLIGFLSSPRWDVRVNPANIGCADPENRILEDFVDGNDTNLVGGSWSAYSDTSSLASKAGDSARGTSSVSATITAGDPVSGELGFVKLSAGLHKNVPGSFAWRPYAGWAALSTDFGKGLDLAALTGISFRLRLELPGKHVDGIRFKAHLKGIPEDATHFVDLPILQVDPTSPRFSASVCIGPGDLNQPFWVSSPASFNPADLERLTWEIKIEDKVDPSIASDSVVFQLSDLRLHKDSGRVAVERRAPRASFSASYTSGRLTVQLPTGHHEVSVVSPAGRVVLQHRGEVRAFPVALERGTWLVVTRGPDGAMASRKLVVLGAH